MWVHNVYFWLDRGLSQSQLIAFCRGLESLRGIESVRGCYIGKSADVDRPVVDTTYDYALTVLFENAGGHALYQAHEKHQAFLSQFKPFWKKVVIYDHEESGR